MKAGWSETVLGDVCHIQSGAGFPLVHQGHPEGDFPFFKVGDMNTVGNEEYLIQTANRISEEVRKTLGAKILPPASIVFPKVGGAIATNKKRRIKVPSCVDNNVMGLIPKQDRIAPDFLAWWMHGVDIYEFSNKANPPSITKATVRDWPIPLPPLEEQQRIVAVLDEAFEGLARARAHAEANLQNARELMANTIDSLMLSDGTTAELELGELCKFENGDRGKNYPGRKAFVPTGVPFINAGHLLNGPIDWENMNFIPLEHFNRLSNGKVRQGDLLFCLRGSLGKFGTVNTNEAGAIASSLVIVRPGEQLLAEYLAAYFESSRCAQMIQEYGNGAAQPNLSAKSLAAFKIALPELRDQSKVVTAVSEVRHSVEALSQAYMTKLQDIDDLRQSLSQKAFAGELT